MARGRTSSVLSADPEVAREQIMRAAETVFERYGLSKTTMDDIGREAGVSRPTVYRYFRDRDSLISAIIERRSRKLFAKTRKYIATQPTFADKLVNGMVFLVDGGRKDDIIRILVSPEHMQMAQTLIGSAGLALRLTAEIWGPVLDEAAANNELREDLDREKTCEWLAMVQFFLVGRLDFDRPDDPSHRQLLRTFVLPAFEPVTS